jgi:hypothetical protein
MLTTCAKSSRQHLQQQQVIQQQHQQHMKPTSVSKLQAIGCDSCQLYPASCVLQTHPNVGL